MGKKLTSIIICLSIFVLQCVNVFAADIETENIDLDTLNDIIEAESIEKNVSENSFVQNLWNIATDNGCISVNESGHVIIDESISSYLTATDCKQLQESVAFCNEMIDVKLIKMNPTTMTASNLKITEETLQLLKESQADMYKQADMYLNNISLFSGTHCNLEGLHLNILVQNNRNTILQFRANAAGLPGVNAYAMTVTYWVSLVCEGGAWDYKVQPLYKGKTFCCTYAGGTNIHRTAEYIGNYNYGYTGADLFSLGVLHLGSAAVGGGVEKDQHDWPAIDEGYYHNPTT